MTMQKAISRLRWLGAGTILVGLTVASLFPGNLRAANATRELRERIIRRLPIERNEPLRIREVKVKGRKMRNREKFVSDEDWLSGLTINIKNGSDQVILLATIQFPRPSGSEGPIAIADMYFGNRALRTRFTLASERSSGIAPGQAVDIELPIEELDAVRLMLAGTGYPANIEAVDLRISSVIFEMTPCGRPAAVCRGIKTIPTHGLMLSC